MDDFKREASVMSVKFRQVMKDYFEVPVSIAVSLIVMLALGLGFVL